MIKIFKIFFWILVLLYFFPQKGWGASFMYQRCRPSSDCILGEYVFDATGSPILSSACTIDIYNPSETLIVNDGIMTPAGDGWHSYTINYSEPQGFYRALMTCSYNGEVGYLDKSFYLGSSFEDTGTNVWNYSTRTLSSFGSLIADIWQYSTRTLTSFGTLIADIWSYATRTLTESALTAQNVWEYATRTLTGASLSSGELATKSTLETATGSAVLSIKTTNDYDLADIIAYVDTLETNIGNSSDTSSDNTLFGKIKAVQESIDQLNTIDLNIDSLISKWGSYSASDIYDKVKNLSSDISAINTVSNVSSILSLTQTNETNIKEIKNKVLAMKAVVDVNRTLLEKVGNQPVIKTWLEEGSIIFKTLINNPSTVTSQVVPLKYYLPRELKKEDILKTDEDLKVDYDASQEAFYVYGEFELAPKETKIISVEVKDIWQISEEEINSLRQQAEELNQLLKGTSYFTQGGLIKSEINLSLDKILRLKKEATTPQGRIRAYREAKTERQLIAGKLDNLKTLVASAGSMGTMFGFIGGVQTLGVWGLIIVLIAGFVFLSLYFRVLILQTHQPNNNQSQKTTVIDFWAPLRPYLSKKLGKFILFIFLVSGSVMFFFNFIYPKIRQNKLPVMVNSSTKEENILTITPPPSPQVETPSKNEEIQITDEKQVLGTTSNKVKIIVPENEAVNIRQEPNLDSPILGKFWTSREADKISQENEWVKIKVNIVKENNHFSEGWIHQNFVEEANQ